MERRMDNEKRKVSLRTKSEFEGGRKTTLFVG